MRRAEALGSRRSRRALAIRLRGRTSAGGRHCHVGAGGSRGAFAGRRRRVSSGLGRVVGTGLWCAGISAVRRHGRPITWRRCRVVAGRPRLVRAGRRDRRRLVIRPGAGIRARLARAGGRCDWTAIDRWRRHLVGRPVARPHGGKGGVEPGITGGRPFAGLRSERRPIRSGGPSADVLAGRRPGVLAVRRGVGPFVVRLPRWVRQRRWRRQIRPAGLLRRRPVIRHLHFGGPAAQRLEPGRGLCRIAGGQSVLGSIGGLGPSPPRVVRLWRCLVVGGLLPRVVWNRTRRGPVRPRCGHGARRALLPSLLGGFVLVAAPALAALVRARGFGAFRFWSPVLEPSASAAGCFLDEFVVREILYRCLVAGLCDVTLGQPRRQHGQVVVVPAHDFASLAFGSAGIVGAVLLARSLRSLTAAPRQRSAAEGRCAYGLLAARCVCCSLGALAHASSSICSTQIPGQRPVYATTHRRRGAGPSARHGWEGGCETPGDGGIQGGIFARSGTDR